MELHDHRKPSLFDQGEGSGERGGHPSDDDDDDDVDGTE